MRSRLGPCLLAGLSLLAVATTATADIDHNPLKLRWVGEVPKPKAWEACDGVLEIEAGRDVQVSDLRFESEGWRLVELEVAKDPRLKAGQTLRIPFRAVPVDPKATFGLSYEVEGRTWTRQLRLRPLAELRSSMGRLVPKHGEAPADLQWPRKLHPGPDGDDPAEPETVDTEDTTGPSVDKARSIRVLGRFEYERGDNVWEVAGDLSYEIYDADTGWDELLASGTIPADGQLDRTFTWDPCWACDSNPDIYVEVFTQNSFLDVQTALWEQTYGWDTYTVHDYTGSLLQFSTMSIETNQFAAHTFRTILRAFDILYIQGYGLDDVDVQTPDIDGSFYSDVFEEIHIGQERIWEEGSYLHELGHHWADQFTQTVDPDYDNGWCDPGHCRWCEEEIRTSEQEGFAHFMSYSLGWYLQFAYDPEPSDWRYMEYLPASCTDGVNPCPCTPAETEGFIAAFLTDLVDDHNENDEARDANWRDETTLDRWEILQIADLENPSTFWDWWDELKQRYPAYTELMWETGRNCGFELDSYSPFAVTNLHSPSHDGVGASPDATISFNWTTAVDDASGIDGYAVALTEGAPAPPGASVQIGDFTHWVSDPVAPGTYYLTIRAIDRSGKAGVQYATHGPITIREPYLSDLIFATSPSWPQAVLPYPEYHTDVGSPPQPTTLPGWTSSTYWNFRGSNNGESAIPELFYNRLFVDGLSLDDMSLGGGSPWSVFAFKNRGPVAVPAGRHTFEVGLDDDEVVPETNEGNNHLGYQYIWNPLMLTLGQDLNTFPPPDPIGGWPSVPSGAWYNANGYRFDGSGTGYWHAVWMHPWDDEADYSLRLHAMSTGATDGFATNLGYSARPPGCLEAVIVNRNATGVADWDVGILYASGNDDANPRLRHIESVYLGQENSVAIQWGNSPVMNLYEFRVPDTAEGAVSIVLQTENSSPVYLAWLDEDFVTGDLLDARRTEVTDATGLARMDLDIERVGYHGLAVYRDPKDGLGPVDLQLDVYLTPEDFVPFFATGWYAPIVPRPFHANTPFSVSSPDTLYGNTFPPQGTFLNLCAKNEGPPDAANVPSYVYLDGTARWSYEWPVMLSGIAEKLHWDTARSVRGGRHTLSFHVDDPDGTAEISETNNIYGEQWVWSPLSMSYNAHSGRSSPPDRLGGWPDVTSGETRWYNCDGLRVPKPTSHLDGEWQVVAVMPGSSSNVDVRLHEVEGGVKDGFGPNLVGSFWGPAQLDYVLVNNLQTPRRAFDVGVLLGQGTQPYNFELRNSIDLGMQPVGVHGPFNLPQASLLHAYQLALDVGVYRITLVDLRGDDVHWGMALHDDVEAFQSRSMAMEDATAWFNGPGEDEEMVVIIDRRAWYCLTIWKAVAGSTQLASDYRFEIEAVPVGEPELPQVVNTRICETRPNPFNPRTTIAFELAQEGKVRLEVFDARGGKVRTLLSERKPRGRHLVEWSGRDEQGHEVASGVYLVRLEANGVSDRRKVVLIK